MTYQTLNPSTEELIQTYPEATTKELDQAGQRAVQAFSRWKQSHFSERASLFRALAERLRKGKGELASLITQEMGKPIGEAEAEIEKCALGCAFYAEQGERFLKAEAIPSDAGKSYVRYDPLGVILVVMPWNFPFWQVFRCSVPAMIAGNAIILKHAPNVPACAKKIAELFETGGFPQGIFQSLFLSNEAVARLIESPFVQAISLTGSDRAGSQVAAVAGRVIKKTVMELGGCDPFIILSDADLEKCIPMALRSRMLNAGQSCIAAKRFLVSQEIVRDFEKAFVQAVEGQKVGDPMERSTAIGPLAREDLLANLVRQVEESRKQGAVCLVGGERLNRRGFFYRPTVLKEVRPGMACFEEETFGPVASIVVVKNEEEAIGLANQTSYGLGASLWTRDLDKAEALAKNIDAGSVFINGMTKSDPRLPFGGIKRSGYGRELSSFGIREFTNLKTVWIA